MQAPPPQPHRLHWIPVDPSWLVSAGLVVLGVLPHQVPATFRRAMRAPLGAVLFAAAAAWVWVLKPVLGSAMAIFLAAIVIYETSSAAGGYEPSLLKKRWAESRHASYTEGFMSAPTLVRDRVQKNTHRWYQEVAMQEKPKVIQERTGGGRINVDTVFESDATPWHDEPEGAPHAIQERTVPEHSLAEHDEDLGTYE
jgi:hypothetical protein